MPIVHDDNPRAYNGVGVVEMDRTLPMNRVMRRRYYYNTNGNRVINGNRPLPRYRYYRRANIIPINSEVEVDSIQNYIMVPYAQATPNQIRDYAEINAYTRIRVWNPIPRPGSWGPWQGPLI